MTARGIAIIGVLGMLFGISGCQAGQGTEQSGTNKQVQAVGLLCEYMPNPLGLDTLSPRLSWRMESARRGQNQTAYQIIAASSPENLKNNEGDLWDTGKVDSAQTLHIAYQGKPLASYQHCYWKVRLWDKDGRPSAWSEPASWTMGILSQDEWKGQWLGYTKAYSTPDELSLKGKWKQQSPSPMFRKTFAISKSIKNATLHVCGLGFHEVYLNGSKVGDHVLDPAFTRYDRACLYVTHDVTRMLQKGGNAVGVMLGNGWYNVFTSAAWKFNEAPWRDQPRMLLQLRIEYTDGTSELVTSDASWKATTGPVVLDGIRQGESYDARREMPGWCTADFDDSGWDKPQIVPAPKGTLRAQMMPPVKVIQTIRPVRMNSPKPGVYIFDLGQNISGWAQLKVSGPAGTKVQMRYGERLHKDGTLDQREIKEHVYEEVFHTDTYVLKGKGVETWEPRFTYYGYQYVELTGFPGIPTLDSITGRVVHTAFEQAGQFKCSNDLINKIHHCTLWAYRGNYVGIPTDCPHREKNGWTGDAQIAVDQAMFNWFNGAAYTKWMMDCKDEQKDTGELPGIIPTGGWGYAWGNGPAWDSAYLIIPWTMYQYYGDVRILETHFDRFKRYVDYLTRRAESHIVKFGLGDWAPVKTTTPEALTSTAYYYVDALITAKAAQILGQTADAEKYNTLAGQIKDAFNKTFYKGNGIYEPASQTALCFPLFYDLVPQSERPMVVKNLVKNIESQAFHIDTGILGAKAIYNVLSDNGQHQTAWQMLMQTTRPSYGYWIEQGATTLWEQWDGTCSRNHIMFGDIGAWFYKNLAGINIDAGSAESVAFGHFILRPRLIDGLLYVDASVQSIRGKIGSSWTVDGNRMQWTVEIPANTTATVHIPTADAASITESGQPVAQVAGLTFVGQEDGYAVYKVPSGQYQFASRIR